MSSLATVPLVALFAAAAVVIWLSGIRLADATDALDTRLGLGAALGGLVLLAFATNLPEIAITVTGAASGDLSLAVGNLVGGIAIQTVVLAVLDVAVRGRRPLSFLAGSLVLAIEAAVVIALIVVAMSGAQLPAHVAVAGVSPVSVVLLLGWLGGLALVRRGQHGLPWDAEAPEAQPGRAKHAKTAGAEPVAMKGDATAKVAAVFAVASLLTLGGGVLIEETGSELASRMGLSGAVFGATILAATTALPEVSTGLQTVRIGDHQLALSDIFGGNAFLMVLFLVADLVGGRPALPQAQATDLWIAGVGVVLTAIYVVGLIMRPSRRWARMGPDSIAVVVLYALGVIGLTQVA